MANESTIQNEITVLDRYGTPITSGLTEQQREVLRLGGVNLMPLDAVSAHTGIEKEIIQGWMRNDEEFRREFDRAMLLAPTYLAPFAWSVVVEMLHSDYPSEKLKAARLVLEAGGYLQIPEINVNVRNDDAAELIRKTALEIMSEFENKESEG